MKKALIISSFPDITSSVEALLHEADYRTILKASSGNEVRRNIRSEAEPEIIVIVSPLTDEFGQELALMLSETTSSGILLLCRNFICDDLSEKVAGSGIEVVPLPLNRTIFLNSVKRTSAARSRMTGIKKENSSLLSKIDEMRLINRAKCTLMEYLKFTEPQAHKYIEKQAMNNRQTRREVALKILSSYKK